MPKKDRYISVYLFDIKKSVDVHVNISASISTDDHVEMILDELFENYDNFVTSTRIS